MACAPKDRERRQDTGPFSPISGDVFPHFLIRSAIQVRFGDISVIRLEAGIDLIGIFVHDTDVIPIDTSVIRRSLSSLNLVGMGPCGGLRIALLIR